MYRGNKYPTLERGATRVRSGGSARHVSINKIRKDHLVQRVGGVVKIMRRDLREVEKM